MKIAIVYDWLDKWGGVERLLIVLHRLYPSACFFTSYFDKQNASWAKELSIHTSFIQKLPRFIRSNRILSFFLYPLAFERFDFSEFDTVISVSSSFAKSIVTKPETRHINILLTPTRYLWLYPEQYLPSFVHSLLKPILRYFRYWDKIISRRADLVVAISLEVKKRSKLIYQINPQVIYPPFDESNWLKIKNNIIQDTVADNEYYLVVARLEPYKKIDMVIDVFNKYKHKRLVIVGSGSMLQGLKRKVSGNNITFMNKISDRDLGRLYMHAEALIMPQEEDFGYVSLEAQFFGTPIIAFHKGGAVETVIPNKTGIFFSEQTSSSLERCIEKYDKIKDTLKRTTQIFGPSQCAKFSLSVFTDSIKNIINSSSNKL